jgi:hypothetical protein
MTLGESAVVPVLGGTGMGTGAGAGLGVGAGLIGGLLLGGLLGNNGSGGLFGGNKNNGGDVAYDALQTQIQTLQGQVGANAVRDDLGDINTAILQGQTGIQSNLGSITRDIIAGQSGLATAQATSAFTTLQSVNDLGRDIQAQSNQQALQQLNSFNNLTTTTLQGFNVSAMQIQNSTNQIIAQGTANAAAMAECCCEIKSTILADGNATRALINDLNVQNLRDQLAAANNKVSNNEQNQYLLSTILTHLHPTSVVV